MASSALATRPAILAPLLTAEAPRSMTLPPAAAAPTISPTIGISAVKGKAAEATFPTTPATLLTLSAILDTASACFATNLAP